MYQLASHKPNIITRCGDSLLSTNPIADYLFSDHFKVISDLTIKKPSLTIKQISYRKTKSIDIESFKNDLLFVSTVLIALMSWSTYTTQHCLTHLMHTLLLSPRPSSRPLVPWYSMEINEARRERWKAERKWWRTWYDSALLTWSDANTVSCQLHWLSSPCCHQDHQFIVVYWLFSWRMEKCYCWPST